MLTIARVAAIPGIACARPGGEYDDESAGGADETAGAVVGHGFEWGGPGEAGVFTYGELWGGVSGGRVLMVYGGKGTDVEGAGSGSQTGGRCAGVWGRAIGIGGWRCCCGEEEGDEGEEGDGEGVHCGVGIKWNRCGMSGMRWMGVLWTTRRYKCRAEQKAAIYTESRSGIESIALVQAVFRHRSGS